MKNFIKLIIICAIIGVCYYGFISSKEKSANVNKIEKEYNDTVTIADKIEKVNFEGHTYLIYREYKNLNYYGFCHDENCPCKKDTIK